MTTSLSDICAIAEKAINQSYEHYFHHLTTSGEKLDEIKFIAAMISSIQTWLLFTEESLEELTSLILKSPQHLNLIYTLTSLFRQRFVLPDEDYKKLVNHLANSFFVQENQSREMSLMPEDYFIRLTDPNEVELMMLNNRHLVMIACTMLYLDTSVITRSMNDKP